MSNQAPDPIPKFFQNGSLQFCSRSSWEPEWEMCFPSPGHKKSTMSSQVPDPTPNFSKIALCSSVRGSGWGPEWKMCFPSPGHKKSTMSNQACDPTPNFSKMVLCSFVRVQVRNLSGKCASFPWAIKNQQCPIRLLILHPTFPKWSFAVLLGFRLGA